MSSKPFYSQYLNTEFSCSCGKVHRVPIKSILIQPDAFTVIHKWLPQVVPGKRGLLIADTHTYSLAGEAILSLLKEHDYRIEPCILEGEPIVKPNAEAILQVLASLDPEMDFLIAVGSGTLNDITRFVSHKTGKPYVIAATAPSMDGYASTVSPLLVNGFKRTYPTVHPQGILADTRILCQAPREMILAGFGDILGKLTALADWQLGTTLLGETPCPTASRMVESAVQKVLEHAPGLKAGKEESIEALMEALVLSGIAIMLAGSSRPASGCEHHIAHYLEMRYFMEGREPLLHGTKVGMATLYAAALYHQLEKVDPSLIQIDSLVEERPDYPAWCENIQKVFGPLAPEVIEEMGQEDWTPGIYRHRLEAILAQWESRLRPILKGLPSLDQIKEWMAQAGADFSIEQLAVDPGLVEEALLYAKEIRTRYTALRLASDIGLLNRDFVQKIMALL